MILAPRSCSQNISGNDGEREMSSRGEEGKVDRAFVARIGAIRKTKHRANQKTVKRK